MATYGLKDVAKAGSSSPLLFFQLYVIKNRDFTAKLLRGASSYFQICAAQPCIALVCPKPGLTCWASTKSIQVIAAWIEPASSM